MDDHERSAEHEQQGERGLDKFAAEQAESAEQAPDPHHELNNPVGEPDPDEWPDPYDRRPDPRGPYDPDEQPAAPATGATSTSEPHPGQDPQARELEERRKRDRLDS